MPKTLIANVLSRQPIALSADALIAALRARFEDLPVSLILPRIEGKRGFALSVDGSPVIPVFEEVALCLDGLKPWHGHLRDSDGALLDNAAHVMVGAPLQTDDHRATLKASMAALRVASVISEAPGAHAVLWSPAETLTPARAFRDAVARASDRESALDVLTRIGQFQAGWEGGKPLIGVWAMGLSAFIGRDIEFVPKPLPAVVMFTALASAANWLILKGPVFKDGDTCGILETERIRIHHRDHGQMVRTPVLLMEIETLDPASTRLAH